MMTRTHPDLRTSAEAILARRGCINQGTGADQLRLLHELQVHQVELEIQNEALRQAQADSDENLRRLRVACEVAEAASRAKTVFLSTMSHELRTPLAGIMGMLYLARSRATDAKQIEWLSKCDQAAHHLLGVIDDVLDITRMEADHFALDHVEFALASVLDDLDHNVGPGAADKSIGFELDCAPDITRQRLLGDPTRLSQILRNLAGNAVKFTECGGVAVCVRSVDESDTDLLLRFDVRDTGIGISADDQTRLFRPFEQADGSIGRKYGGSGLGLVICKHLAHMMGGSIGVDSQPGQGSTFWFTARLGKLGNLAQGGQAMPGDHPA